MREDPENFAELQQFITRIRLRHGLTNDLALQSDLKQQSRLIDWKEYHSFQLMLVRRATNKYNEEVAAKSAANTSDVQLMIGDNQIDTAREKLESAMEVLEWIEQEMPKIAQEPQSPNETPLYSWSKPSSPGFLVLDLAPGKTAGVQSTATGKARKAEISTPDALPERIASPRNTRKRSCEEMSDIMDKPCKDIDVPAKRIRISQELEPSLTSTSPNPQRTRMRRKPRFRRRRLSSPSSGNAQYIEPNVQLEAAGQSLLLSTTLIANSRRTIRWY